MFWNENNSPQISVLAVKKSTATCKAFKSQLFLLQFCPYIGYNNPVLNFVKLCSLLDVWLVTRFYLNSCETPFSTWSNFITWKLLFYSGIAQMGLRLYCFTSFLGDLINSVRALCPLDEITQRKDFIKSPNASSTLPICLWKYAYNWKCTQRVCVTCTDKHTCLQVEGVCFEFSLQ